MLSRSLILAVLLLPVLPSRSHAQDDPTKLSLQTRHIFETHCYRCHGKDGAIEGGFNYILDAKRLVERKRIVPKDADKSRVWLRVSSTDLDVMPPPSQLPRPSKADIDIVKKWIDAGAPEFPAVAIVEAPNRPFLDERYVYKAMYNHLLTAEITGSARFQRYFTLTHLHNNSKKINDAQLRLYRAGLAKLLNSLSWRKNIILPKPVDEHGVVLAIDLRDLDWDLSYGWEKLIGRSRDKKNPYPGYPYALKHDRYPEDDDLNVTARQVYKLTGTDFPAVRGLVPGHRVGAAALP